MKRPLILVVALALVLVAIVVLRSGTPVTNPVPRGETIICFGDSLTFGTGAGPEESYPAQLERLIGEPVVNAGVPGDTTSSALARLERDVVSRSPRIVLITLGGNDLKNGVAREEAFANLEAIVSRIHSEGALVVVGGIDVPFYGRGYGSGYEDLQESTGCVLVPNVFKGIMGRRELMSDRIHPNGDGYSVMAAHFHRAVKPYL